MRRVGFNLRVAYASGTSIISIALSVTLTGTLERVALILNRHRL